MTSTSAAAPPDRWRDLQQSLVRLLSQRLFDDVARQPMDPAQGRVVQLRGSLWLAYALATLVFATSIAFGIGGLLLLWGTWGSPFIPIAGVMLLMLCYVARPRWPDPPESLLSPEEFPTLFGVARKIAQQLHAPPPDGIGVSADYNANYRLSGWKQRRYVELGAPFMAVLTPAERIAVIAHELSHGANRDPLRGQFLHGATRTLVQWALAVRPDDIGRSAGNAIVSLAAIPFELCLLALSEALLWCVRGFMLLVLRESQRAEYFADLLAATVAGSEPMRSALAKTWLHDSVDTALQQHALTAPHKPLPQDFFAAATAVTPEAAGKLQEEARSAQWQVDATHPPTAMRIEMLALRPQHAAGFTLSAEEQLAFDAEVDRLIRMTQREMVNRRLEAAYG